ncbi:MAG: carboxymuconolactone decarboxylase family protein [Candidatus Hodarchaeales archaeon]
MFNERETEIAAISASLASNCVRCLRYHVKKARKLGINDNDLLEIANLAFKIRENSERFHRMDFDDILVKKRINSLKVNKNQNCKSNNANCCD